MIPVSSRRINVQVAREGRNINQIQNSKKAKNMAEKKIQAKNDDLDLELIW